MSGNRPEVVRLVDLSLPRNKPEIAMSGNRPETVRLLDDFRTVSGHWHARGLNADSNVRKPSGSRPPQSNAERVADQDLAHLVSGILHLLHRPNHGVHLSH